jgi:hypothetical protein
VLAGLAKRTAPTLVVRPAFEPKEIMALTASAGTP